MQKPEITTSKKFSLDWKDAVKGFLVAMITAALTVAAESLEAGSLELDWVRIAVTSLSAGIAYLLKNFFTPSVTQTPNK